MLNLLPPQKREELHLNLLHQAILGVAVSIIFIIIALILLLLLSRTFLNFNLNETKRELNLWQAKPEIKEVEDLEKQIKELNEKLTFLDEAYKKQTKFSSFLEDLSGDMPAGIIFNNISIKDSGEVNIEGYASTREVLLFLKGTLEKASYVSEFNFPLSNLTKTTNITFYLNFKLIGYGL